MNMPFELGIDHACKRFGDGQLREKAILVLEQSRYDCQKSLSDIAGWDIEVHGGSFEKAVRNVSTWLITQVNLERIGSSAIIGKYIAFQEWYFERERTAGSSEEDIKEYPTMVMIKAMHEWMDAGQPV